MRVLPRSAKGTWLLAAAGWVGMCALAWFVLPPRPRAVVTVAGTKTMLGVGPGGRIVTFTNGEVDGRNERVRVWDTLSGTLQWIGNSDFPNPFGPSADGRWLVGGGDDDNGHRRVRIMDLVTGSEGELPETPNGPMRYEFTIISPDSKWLAIAEQDKNNRSWIRLWNLAEARPAGSVNNVYFNVVFSADGKRLATALLNEPVALTTEIDFAILDSATGRIISRFPAETGFDDFVAITADGAGLIGEHYDRQNAHSDSEIRCWNISDGSLRWKLKNGLAIAAADGDRRCVVLLDPDSYGSARSIVIIDCNDGRTLTAFPVEQGAVVHGVSSDGRAMFIDGKQLSLTDRVREWLARLGLPVSMPSPERLILVNTKGQRLLSLPAGGSMFGSDGKSFVYLEPGSSRMELWDIPPRKPLGWFAVGAGILALPIALLARRRVRRLRKVAA